MSIKPKRDQIAAEGAVHMAADHGKRPGIAVDDDICLEAMLPRVTGLLDKRGLTYDVKRPRSGVIEVTIAGGGTVVIVAMVRTGN